MHEETEGGHAMELRIPGPTPVPPEVLQAGAQPMINHRGQEFAELIRRITARMKTMFMTKSDLFLLTGSGTGALEASVVNMLSPGDKVLSVIIGEFGERYAEIAKVFGANVVPLNYEYGMPADPDDIRKALRADSGFKAVMVTHNETSTGVTNDIKTIFQVVQEFGLLLLVDSVSGIGSLRYPVDEWGGDVVSTGSQKGWMAPPGIAMVSISEKGWEAHKSAKMPRAYWDFTAAKKYLERDQTPWTPALSVLFALDKGLEILEKEGLENVQARHARVAGIVRDGARALGLKLLVKDERYASNTVTAIWPPDGVDANQLVKAVRVESDIELAGGQGPLTGKIFRVGHLGWVSEKDAQNVIDSLRIVLPKLGFKTPAAASR